MSTGIGAATARAQAASGYRLALLARRADPIEALAREFGHEVIAIEADVTDRDAPVAAAERVHKELGGTDVLINNAGVMLLAPFTSELPTHITDAQTKEMAQQLYAGVAVTPEDIAEIIASR
jgi:NADP-dependent 3-hydroxy acid dehydrogenase YdfG